MACRWNFDLYVNRQTAVVADVGKCAVWYGTLLPLVTILEISRISGHLLYFGAILVDTTENPNFNYQSIFEETVKSVNIILCV